MSKRIIIVAPHPDDEIIACAGIIQKHLENNSCIKILFITNGENAYSHLFGIIENPSPTKLGEIRKEEAKQASGIMGISENDLIFLEFNDGYVADQYNDIKNKVIKILDAFKPDLLYVPYKNSSHSDHRATFKIVYDSINELEIYPTIYSYLINIKYNRLFYLLLLYWSVLCKKVVIQNISKYSTKKTSAFEQYKSQLTIFNPLQKKPVLTNNRLYRILKRYEFFIKE